MSPWLNRWRRQRQVKAVLAIHEVAATATTLAIAAEAASSSPCWMMRQTKIISRFTRSSCVSGSDNKWTVFDRTSILNSGRPLPADKVQVGRQNPLLENWNDCPSLKAIVPLLPDQFCLDLATWTPLASRISRL